ncbi:MAG: threonine aldolase family protein [Myxococcota bacterium]
MTQPHLLVDLVSDTATRPTAGMLAAMASAITGDEQKGEDPTTKNLEERVAALLGTEAALFLPSATLANQIALALHAGPGDEVVCHRSAHIFNYETGGTAVTARAQTFPLDGARGFFGRDELTRAIRKDDPHLPRTAVVVVENTSNSGGGGVWPDRLFDEVADLCDESGIPLHIDGARLMNASVRAGVPPARWGKRATTVQMCFSKGLGCPFGAVLGLPASMWPNARRWKQRLGGALRQSGIVTAAMHFALDHHVPLLALDHGRAERLGTGLAALPCIDVEPIETNLVFFHVRHPHLGAAGFCENLLKAGVRMGAVSETRVRACLHHDVSDQGVDLALAAAAAVLESAAG